MKNDNILKKLKYIFSKTPAYFKNKIVKQYPLFDFNRPVVIFGAAKMGKVFLELCRKNGIVIVAFCDNDWRKQGTNVGGVPVLDVQMLNENFSKNAQIIIASVQDELIMAQLKKMYFKKVWSYSFFLTLYPKKFFAFAHTSDFNEKYKNKSEIFLAFSLLSDMQSKQVFLYILLYRLTLDKTYIQRIKKKESKVYFDGSVLELTNNEVFLDGGAYDGDTLDSFTRVTNNKFSHVYCFEPDSSSYNDLRVFVDKSNEKARITCIKEGLGEKRKTVKFTNEGNLQSAVNETGSTIVNIVPIDDYLNKKITMIKLDIEGYEKQALSGAKKVIKKYHPKLAICSYHYQEDLWKIPLLIRSIDPNYKLYLRHYNSEIFETICYGV